MRSLLQVQQQGQQQEAQPVLLPGEQLEVQQPGEQLVQHLERHHA